MKIVGKFKLERYLTSTGKSPVNIWMDDQEISTQARLEARFFNIERVNIGDHRYLGDEVWQLKFHFGAGYRITDQTRSEIGFLILYTSSFI